MMSLQKIFARYTGLLRRIKAVYVINNALNAKQLQHNKTLYKKYGIRKSILSPIGSADFSEKQTETEIPWLDRPDALNALEQDPRFSTFSPMVQQQLRQFVTEGYMILENFFPQEKTDALNKEVDALLESGKADFNYSGRKIFNLYKESALADSFLRNPEILELLSYALGKTLIPFQTLNFTLGSEQRAHSDFIHMTTEPKGYLIATWIALEDCSLDNGPLAYYPGSHRLPYVLSGDYDSGNTRFTIGAESNRRYEDKIESIIKQKNLQKKPFLAKRGDVLVWHANLLHAGSPILQKGATRKSMVCHYYAEDVICYHEMSQRPALIS